MTTLSLIDEPFPDWEHEVQRAVARELTAVLADTAPRGCGVRLLVARGGDQPVFDSARIRTEAIPLKTSMLPILWQTGTTARPLDGEFAHALTPMIPLRGHGEDDGTQTSVTVPHALAWEAPGLLGTRQARLYRNFVRRAVKYADVIVTPTHATASVLQQHYGADLPVQVMPLAAPESYRRPDDAAERHRALELPERYIVTTATPTEHGRLDWLLDALRLDSTLPPLVVLDGCDPRLESEPPFEAPADLAGRVVVVRPRELADIGAVLSGAALLAQPQQLSGTCYLLLGALTSGVPVLHAGLSAYRELALDAGLAAEDPQTFSLELSRVLRDTDELAQLQVLAEDRSRAFSWQSTAWQLWELHANL